MVDEGTKLKIEKSRQVGASEYFEPSENKFLCRSVGLQKLNGIYIVYIGEFVYLREEEDKEEFKAFETLSAALDFISNFAKENGYFVDMKLETQKGQKIFNEHLVDFQELR